MNRASQKSVARATIAASAVALVLTFGLGAPAGPNVKTVDVAQANSSLVTVIYKNQLYPSVGELAAQALTEQKGEANTRERLVFRGRGQWI